MIKQKLSYLSRWAVIIPKLSQHDDAFPIYLLPIHTHYYAIPFTVVCAIVPSASIYPHLYSLYPPYQISYRFFIVASTIINTAVSITFIVYLIVTTFYTTAIIIIV